MENWFNSRYGLWSGIFISIPVIGAISYLLFYWFLKCSQTFTVVLGVMLFLANAINSTFIYFSKKDKKRELKVRIAVGLTLMFVFFSLEIIGGGIYSGVMSSSFAACLGLALILCVPVAYLAAVKGASLGK